MTRAVKIIADIDPTGVDRWYVTTGAKAVGPVELGLITRGVQAGKVPLESFVRHEAWKVWRPLREIATVSETSTPSDPEATDDITSPGRPAFPGELDPADAIAGAADLREALLLLMAASVQRTGAEGALVHQIDDEGAVVSCAHGPESLGLLGERTRAIDPVLVAAAAGVMVLAEPSPGPAGQALLGRIARLGISANGAFMVPVLHPAPAKTTSGVAAAASRQVIATIELGRRTPFRGSEIACVEALASALSCLAPPTLTG